MTLDLWTNMMHIFHNLHTFILCMYPHCKSYKGQRETISYQVIKSELWSINNIYVALYTSRGHYLK